MDLDTLLRNLAALTQPQAHAPIPNRVNALDRNDPTAGQIHQLCLNRTRNSSGQEDSDSHPPDHTARERLAHRVTPCFATKMSNTRIPSSRVSPAFVADRSDGTNDPSTAILRSTISSVPSCSCVIGSRRNST